MMRRTKTALSPAATSCELLGSTLFQPPAQLPWPAAWTVSTVAPPPSCFARPARVASWTAPGKRLRVTFPSCGIERPERYNATDWARALRTLPRSVVLKRIRGHIVANVVAAVAVCAGSELVSVYAPDVAQHLNLTFLPHTFMVTAMSLLLVLRSNAAYDRFWEGRKLWGSLVNCSRNAARVCAGTMPKSHSVIAGRLIVCYAYALMHHLQGRREDELIAELCKGVIVPDELLDDIPISLSMELRYAERSLNMESSASRGFGSSKSSYPTWSDVEWDDARRLFPAGDVLVIRINAATNKPLEIALLLSTLIKRSLEWKEYTAQQSRYCPSFRCNGNVEKEKLELYVSELIDILGKCERIVKSPIPLSWNRHTSRLISLWTLTLPFALVPLQGPLCIPTVAVISWVLFSIEEIGHLLEDPFRRERYAIPLHDICETVREDVLMHIMSPL